MEQVNHEIDELSDETKNTIQDLIRINIDSAKGFATSANEIESPRLKELFNEIAVKRDKAAVELQNIVRLNDEDPTTTGSWMAKVHRWWIEARNSIQSQECYPVLAEAERGEDKIKAEYEDAIKKCSGTPVSKMLHSQYAEVKSAHDQVRDLRDVYKENLS